MLNSKGFTLIEMLLVLSIIMMTSAFSLKYHIPDIDTKKYIDQISDFIYEAKMNAIVTKEKTEIVKSIYYIRFRKSKNKKIYADQFDEVMKLDYAIVRISLYEFLVDDEAINYLYNCYEQSMRDWR